MTYKVVDLFAGIGTYFHMYSIFVNNMEPMPKVIYKAKFLTHKFEL